MCRRAVLSVRPRGARRCGLTVLPSPRLPEEARQRRVFEMVEALQEHPRDPNQVLIGYSRGLIVIWDLRGSRVLCHFLSSQVGGAWAGGSRHGALPDPITTRSPCAKRGGGGGGIGIRTIALTPACALSLSSPEATGQCLLAAGWPPDCQLPFGWQLLPVACESRNPATGALSQLRALRSVLCPPGGGLALPCHLGLPFTVRTHVLCSQPAFLDSGVGTPLIEVKPGAQRGDGFVQSHRVGFLAPVWAELLSRGLRRGCAVRTLLVQTRVPLWWADPFQLIIPVLVGPFPCKAITKIFWLTTKQG